MSMVFGLAEIPLWCDPVFLRWSVGVISREHTKDTKTAPDVSVIIPSFKSAPHVRQCLDALKIQIATCSFEIILVDSSQDATQQIVTEEYPEVRLFHFDERCSVGKARNIGVEKAKAEIVLFLDTDCVPDPTWIDQMYSALQNSDVVAVGGAVANGTPWSMTGSVGFYLEFFRFLTHKGSPYQAYFFMGGNSGFRKKVCQSIPFNDLSVGDDFLFAWNMAKQGKSLMFVPSAVVRHVNRTGLRTVLKYQYLLGKGACLYRQSVSPKLSAFFRWMPFTIFLTPPVVMLWISGIVLKRRNLMGWGSFFPLVPVMLLAHLVWAWGFFLALMGRQDFGSSNVPSNHVAILPTSEEM